MIPAGLSSGPTRVGASASQNNGSKPNGLLSYYFNLAFARHLSTNRTDPQPARRIAWKYRLYRCDVVPRTKVFFESNRLSECSKRSDTIAVVPMVSTSSSSQVPPHSGRFLRLYNPIAMLIVAATGAV